MKKLLIKYLSAILCYTSFYIASSQDCTNSQLDLYYQQIREYIKRHESLAALTYADSILQIIEQKGLTNCNKTLWIKYESAEALELNNKFEEAIQIYQNTIRLSEKEKLNDLIALSHISIARCYETIDRPTECLYHLNVARKLITLENLDTVFAVFCTRYSSYHRIYDNRDSAKLYASKSIYFGNKFNVQRSVYDGHLLMGILSDQLDSSVYHLKKAVQIFSNNGDYHGAASQSMNICAKYVKATLYKEATFALDSAYKYIQLTEINTKKQYLLLNRYHDYKSIIFVKQKKLDSAYHHLKLANEYDKKAEWHVNQENITVNAIEFAIEKEKEKSRYLEKISNVMRWVLIIMGSFLLILAILIYIIQSKKREIESQNKVIKYQNDNLQQSLHKQSLLLSEVHHRVKNNLQLVISLLTLKADPSKSNELKEFAEELSAKIMGIALIHEQLYSTGDFENIEIKEYLNNLIKHYNELQNTESAFDYFIEIKSILLNLETVMPIGIICSELVGNSLKYARIAGKKLKIKISLDNFENKFIFKYSDNGPGILESSEGKNKSKMGLVLLRSMVRQLQAESKMYNDQGVHFNMIFVEKKISIV